MRRSFIITLAIAIPFTVQVGHVQSIDSPTVEQSVVAQVEKTFLSPSSTDLPVRVSIPSIKLNASVVPVGLNEKGEMDVPDGSTKNVGWYAAGTVPGDVGSAVLDAHVFAAFTNLRYVKIGSRINITTQNGKVLQFVVTDSRIYKLSEVPLERLFVQNDARHLNLITCAGKLTPDGSTYDHRLIVYAQLVSS